MQYTVQQLATLAKVSVRTLHHYDAIGLLRPSREEKNGYRRYGEAELLRLQQILFFRELDFPLPEIKAILASPTFDMQAALRDQRNLIEIKKKRLTDLMETIDETITRLDNKMAMDDKKLYDGFDTEEQDQYAEEVKARWGNTEAYKQSKERTKNWTNADYDRLKQDADTWMKAFVLEIPKGATSPEVQKMIADHYNALRTFYEPNLKMYRGLADMYVDDPRFAAYYEKYAPGLAVFMRDAMHFYVDTEEGREK